MKAAYNELLSEKQRSDEAASEVNNLKKELNRAHKVCQSALILLYLATTNNQFAQTQEVEKMKNILKFQQPMGMSKFRKPSEAYNNGIYNEKSSIPAISTQETKTKQKNSDKQKILVRDREMSVASYNDEVHTPRQRSYSRQETKTKQKNSDKQKVLVKDRKMSMANYDDEVLTPRQRSYSSTSNKVN